MEKWVAVLRSGEYKQGRTQLKDGDTYCCLGVLCEISGEYYSDGAGDLSPEVQDWAGMDSSDGWLPKEYKAKDGSRSWVLYELNDREDDKGKSLSFKQIANIIEKNWREL